MSQVETVTPLKKALQPAQAYITGRIASVRRIKTAQGDLFLTVLKMAAPDPYSHPSTIEVRSNTRIGKPDDDWSGVVSLSGMANNYQVKNKETGEIDTVRSARNEFTVVEA